MADFTVADVKTLREQTGAGMMDAKKALTEAGGDIEAAVDALRAKGLAASSEGFNAAIRALGRVAPSWLRPLRLELYLEMEQLELAPDAHAHAAALSELERGGPLAAERTARVRMALDAPTTARASSDGQGGLAWPPLRSGKLGREQSTRAEKEKVPLREPSRVAQAECQCCGG